MDFARSHGDVLLQNDTILNYWLVLEKDDRESNPPGRDFSTIWRDYIRDMKKPGTWATELIVMVAGIYFGMDITVIKDDFVVTQRGDPQGHDHPMVIVNIGDDHFQSVHSRY